MEKFLEKENWQSFLNPPNPGTLVKGKIINKEKSGVFLDLGNFGTGIVKGKEFSEAKSLLKEKNVGDEISAKIIEVDNEEGYIELSLTQAHEESAWLNVKEKKEKGEAFLVTIKKANKGGLTTELNGVPAFLPVSQLAQEHYPRVEQGDQAKILQELQKFIGRELKVKILTLDSKQKTVILSEKKARLEYTKGALEKYKAGDVVKGEIIGIVDWGAFMKFPIEKTKETETTEEPAIEGLIHISELDWQMVENPAEVIKEGDKISAKIIDISDGRISLSLKALKPNPWENIEKEYKKGDIIKAEVVKFNPFGAFVKIKPKIQGLCHISELKNQKTMKENFEIGKKYEFEVLLVDSKEHKISLKPVNQTD